MSKRNSLSLVASLSWSAAAMVGALMQPGCAQSGPNAVGLVAIASVDVATADTATPNATDEVSSGAGEVPAPYYAALFQVGNAWTYVVTTSSQMPENPDPAADSTGTVTSSAKVSCRVMETAPFFRGLASRIECDGSLGNQDQPMAAGVWAATSRGLWHLDSMPEGGVRPKLLAKEMVLPASPADRDEKTGDDESGSLRSLKKRDRAWCVANSSWGGDEAWEQMCFGPGGVTDGESGWAGGSVHETRFTLAE
jgi:hypothetical protein